MQRRGSPRGGSASWTLHAEFRYIARRAREFLDVGQPVVSVTPRRRRRSASSPTAGRMAARGPPGAGQRGRFPFSDAIGKAIPYSTTTWALIWWRASVGTTTSLRVRRGDAAPLVAGRRVGPLSGARRLLSAPIPAARMPPGPGPRGRARPRAAETGLEVAVCHYPPGTSKWKKSSTAARADHPQLPWPAADQPPGRRRADLKHHDIHLGRPSPPSWIPANTPPASSTPRSRRKPWSSSAWLQSDPGSTLSSQAHSHERPIPTRKQATRRKT